MSNDSLFSMGTYVETKELSNRVRVAVVIERGMLWPRWFDVLDKPSYERVQIKEICYRWSHEEGAAKILNFAVSDGSHSYRLSFNTQDFTWRAGVAVGR